MNGGLSLIISCDVPFLFRSAVILMFFTLHFRLFSDGADQNLLEPSSVDMEGTVLKNIRGEKK